MNIIVGLMLICVVLFSAIWVTIRAGHAFYDWVDGKDMVGVDDHPYDPFNEGIELEDILRDFEESMEQFEDTPYGEEIPSPTGSTTSGGGSPPPVQEGEGIVQPSSQGREAA